MKKTLAILILSIVLGLLAPASARAETSPARSGSAAAAAETDETPAKETEAETDEAPARETETETDETSARETEAPATCEGPGFDTQEEAVCAYVESFVRGDFDGMLAACAVETYVDKLDLEKQIERQGVLITPPNAAGYLLPGDAMARALNTDRASVPQTYITQRMIVTRVKISVFRK